MRPTLLNLFGLHFHAYPTLLAVALLVGTMGLVRDMQRRTPPVLLDPVIGIWGLLGAMVGARAYCIIQYGELKDLWRALFFWEPGLVFYGGLIGGGLTVFVYLKRKRIAPILVADGVVSYLALGEAITRIGCFLNGCCWGDVTSLPWGVHFPIGSLAYKQQITDHIIQPTASCAAAVHPTQLYMTFGLLVVFWVLRGLYRHSLPPGMHVAAYGIGYGVLRFIVEGFRGDSSRSVMGMTVSQVISLGFVLAGFVAVLWLKNRKPVSEPSPEGDRPNSE